MLSSLVVSDTYDGTSSARTSSTEGGRRASDSTITLLFWSVMVIDTGITRSRPLQTL